MQSLASQASAQLNSRSRKSKGKKPQANGYSESTKNGSIKGHVVSRSSKAQPPTARRSATGSLFSIIVRLALWYSIITAAFRCPASLSELSDNSPKLCKPYLSIRSHATPYLEPQYNKYLAPYVDTAKPYVDRFNQDVYSPTAKLAKQNYVKYGAPKVAQLQSAAQAQWDSSIRPQLNVAQSKAKAHYDASLGPHVQQVSQTLAPYYNKASSTATDLYQHTLLPAYYVALPYGQKTWVQGHHIIVDVVFPYVRWADASARHVFLTTVWPRLRILYGDNVEPQLLRISERLGRYKDSKKLESVAESVGSETTVLPPSSETESSATSTPNASAVEATEKHEESPSIAVAVEGGKKVLSPEEVQEQIVSDLRTWQEKFAKAADKGSEDLEERVKEIADEQIETQAQGVGQAKITELEEASASALKGVKDAIIKRVKALPETPSDADLEAAEEEVYKEVSAETYKVKSKAKAVRDWKVNYDAETHNLIKAASDSTLDVIDNIRDLGLQEIGMRWAWMDGVTYKDWQKYHELRRTFDEWHDEIQMRALQHSSFAKAKQAGEDIQDKAMEASLATAKEILRLKSVAKWKIQAQDSSDDFTTKTIPPRPLKAAGDVVGKAADAASAAVEGAQDYIESVSSKASEKADQASSSISSAIAGKDTSVAEKVESVASAAKFKQPESKDTEGSVASSATSIIADASASAESVVSAVSGVVESPKIVSDAASSVESAVSAASEAVQSPKKVWGGVAASFVEAREPILDGDIYGDDVASAAQSYSEKLQSLISVAGDKASDITRAINDAVTPATSTQGSVESVTSVAQEHYEKAFSAASSILYGTKQGAVESASSVAVERYAQAVTAASYAIYGTPTPILESIAAEASSRYKAAADAANAQYQQALTAASYAIYGTPTPVLESLSAEASSRYQNAIAAANDQYQIAQSRLSELVSGTPKPVHEQMSSSIEKAYSGALSAASVKYDAAIKYTETVKTAVTGPTPGYLDSVSAVAQSKLSEGLDLASQQFTKAKQAVGTEPTPLHQQYLDAAQQQYYQAVGLAHARYAEFVDAASSAVYGTPDPKKSLESFAAQVTEKAGSLASEASSSIIGSETPWHESIASQASQNWDSLISKASEQVYGKPTPVTASAASQYSAVQALVSELVIGKEAAFTESALSRLSSAYYVGYPAVASSASSILADSYSSASSVINSIFTPPPVIESIIDQANEQINAAVAAASVQIYGSTKGVYEQASESAASAYSAASSQASVYIYGTPVGYAEAAQSSFAAIAADAQSAISVAIYGTPTPIGQAEQVASNAASAYSSVASQMSGNYEAAKARISSAIYGPEQGAIESAQGRIAAAVESAKAKLAEMGAAGGEHAQEIVNSISSAVDAAANAVRGNVEEGAGSVSSVASSVNSKVASAASSASSKVRDEL